MKYFLNTLRPPVYDTLAEAQRAVKDLGITSMVEYRKRYREDPRLRRNPNQVYRKDWQSWPHFLNTLRPPFYDTLAEAEQAAQDLGIKSKAEYGKRYREDPRLPSNPNRVYRRDWQSWSHFLHPGYQPLYDTLAEAEQAAQDLGITSGVEYRKRYREDPRLPSDPNQVYRKDWQSWPHFLNTLRPPVYDTLAEAQQAVQGLGITSGAEYNKRYREDPRLPSDPNRVYRKDWQSWPHFLHPGYQPVYDTLEKAEQVVQGLGIKSKAEYSKRYREDPRLPRDPINTYQTTWAMLLLPKVISSKVQLKFACKTLGIIDSVQYREVRKVYKQLPAHPERMFDDWVDWYDLLDIPRPYSYEKLRAIVMAGECQKMADYQKLRVASQDPRIPAAPEEIYKLSGWTNTYDFFGKTRPYQTKYFEPKWEAWKKAIEVFLQKAKGGDTKAKDLCEFVREYIEPNNFDISPYEYLTRGKTNIQPMLDLFEQVPVTRKKKWLFSINEFLDWIIATDLTIEDEVTGEISRLKGAKNPFSHINFNGEISPAVANETEKLSLPYQYVKQGREWIFPLDSLELNTNYSDLRHLHMFKADWVQINDLSLIDSSDPDCVFRVDGGKTYLWLPIYWTYTYALMQLPARGMQIVYSDSGEADAEIPIIEKGGVTWKLNNGKLANLTNGQGMVCKMGDDFGVHYTSNKTHFNGQGYSIPFMPLDLAYWLIKLRMWQQKYNPINIPTPWLTCKRTNINELQRKNKGANCFLFRDFGDNEPGVFGGRLTNRLAASLFLSAKDDSVVATYKEATYDEINDHVQSLDFVPLSHFKSAYTPHCMRVSLINAYAYEFGLPIELIMKLVGHSSLLMTISYVKSDQTGANIRERLNLGEKLALKNAERALKTFIEQQRIEECKEQLVANSPEFLNTLANNRPASSYLWKDFGICPVGGNYCSEGGAAVAVKSNVYHPVVAGYLGEQNCLQCRFFITGPAFMMGLVAVFNEISLAVNIQSFKYSKLESELNHTAEKIDVLSHKIYEQKKAEQSLLKTREELSQLRRKLNSEIETKAKKIELYMSDMNAIHRCILHSQELLKSHAVPQKHEKLKLIVPKQFEVCMEIDEVSTFHQLSEVCENAELFHSCSDELAVTRRTQALDRMMLNNNIPPKLFLLSEEEQLSVGNQLTQLMIARLKGWETIDKLVDGRLSLMDLSEGENFNAQTIKELFEQSQPLRIVR